MSSAGEFKLPCPSKRGPSTGPGGRPRVGETRSASCGREGRGRAAGGKDGGEAAEQLGHLERAEPRWVEGQRGGGRRGEGPGARSQLEGAIGAAAERGAGSGTGGAGSRSGACSGEAVEAGLAPRPAVGVVRSGGGAQVRAGARLVWGGLGLEQGGLPTVESFSGYAVRYLKPEVTQNWRVRRAAR